MFILVEVSGIKDLLPNFVKVPPSSIIPLQLTADVEKKKKKSDLGALYQNQEVHL